jgi:hypothetical protein
MSPAASETGAAWLSIVGLLGAAVRDAFGKSNGIFYNFISALINASTKTYRLMCPATTFSLISKEFYYYFEMAAA